MSSFAVPVRLLSAVSKQTQQSARGHRSNRRREGRLARAVPNKKGTSVENPKNQAKLSKKLLLKESKDWNEVMEQIEEAVTAEFSDGVLSERRSVETQTTTERTYPVTQEPQEDEDLLSTALRLCVLEIHVPPGFDSVFIDQSMFSSGGVVLFLF